MSESIMVLADGTQVALTGGAALGHMKVHYPDKAAMLADWDKLTVANLKTVQIKTDGTVTGNYDDLILESETSVPQADGSVDTIWNIRNKTELELLRERIDAVEGGQAVQDGAIEDLGAATSAIAEQVGGMV